MKKKNKIEKKISKKKQKKLIMTISISIILLVMLVFLIGYIIGVNTNKQSNLEKMPNNITNNDVPNNNDNWQDNNEDEIKLSKEIYFLQDKNGKKIISNKLDSNLKYLGKYTCQNFGCGKFQYVPSPNDEQQFISDNLVLISEWDGNIDKTVLYNYKTDKVIETYDNVLCSYEFYDKSFSVLVEKNEKMGILKSNGEFAYNIELDNWNDMLDISHYTDSVCHKYRFYSLDANKTPGYDGVNGVVSKDAKFGVVNFKTGEVLVDFKYAGLRLMYDGNYSFYDGKKWYLIDNKMKKIINIGYDMIYSFGDVILVGTNIDGNSTHYKLIDKNGKVLTNTVETNLVNIDEYYEVSSGKIRLGKVDVITFTYDLLKKNLKYDKNY